MCLLWKLGAGDLANDFNMDTMGRQFLKLFSELRSN